MVRVAQKTKVITICDLHRGDVEATATVEISIDGKRQKIDVCNEHLAEVRRAVKPWLARAGGTAAATPRTRRKAGRPAKKSRKKSAPRRNLDGAEIRAWAAKNGYELPARGRIPAAVRTAYESAKK